MNKNTRINPNDFKFGDLFFTVVLKRGERVLPVSMLDLSKEASSLSVARCVYLGRCLSSDYIIAAVDLTQQLAAMADVPTIYVHTQFIFSRRRANAWIREFKKQQQEK